MERPASSSVSPQALGRLTRRRRCWSVRAAMCVWRVRSTTGGRGAAGVRAAANKGARDWSCWALVATGRHRARHGAQRWSFSTADCMETRAEGTDYGPKPQRAQPLRNPFCPSDAARVARRPIVVAVDLSERALSGDIVKKRTVPDRGTFETRLRKKLKSLRSCIGTGCRGALRIAHITP